MVATVVGGALSDRFGRRKPFVFGASCLAGVACVIPLISPTWTGVLAFSIVSGLGLGCYLSVDTALATLVLPSDRDNGRDLSILNMSMAVPQIVAPLIASALVLHVGGYPAVFVGSGVLAVLGALAVIPIRGAK
ncbi:MFS transporter [Fodinicola feengrottensis]|uniref:MFS transporter n=1 Tax=Fodinicola feengrottensis TaxID=435914 RepID=UPI0024418C18|nr:MFS transporter [Fodinicola feengrottensis]